MIKSKSVENKKKTFNIKEIMEILPHRPPFLLIDKIVECDMEKGSILGQKNVTMNEPFFQGHFPGAPIMPGVLILEALAQVGGVLIHVIRNTEKIAVLLSVNNAKFRNPVKPGDILDLKCHNIVASSKGGRMDTVASVNGKVAVQAQIGFALVDKSLI